MITVNEADYNDVLQIRRDVMYPDKELEFVRLDDDDMGIHLGVFDDGHLMTVVSIFLDKERNLQFRKLATRTQAQGRGYASAMIKWIVAYVDEMKLNSLWCNARKEYVGFYKKFGFEETEQIFSRDGYDFVVMRKKTLAQ